MCLRKVISDSDAAVRIKSGAPFPHLVVPRLTTNQGFRWSLIGYAQYLERFLARSLQTFHLNSGPNLPAGRNNQCYAIGVQTCEPADRFAPCRARARLSQATFRNEAVSTTISLSELKRRSMMDVRSISVLVTMPIKSSNGPEATIT